MNPVLFSVGNFKLYSFGSFIALGAIIAGLFLYWQAKQRKLTTGHLFDAVLYSLLFGLIGARIGYYFVYQEQFQTFWQVFYFWQGGLLALTGLAVGLIAFLYFNRQTKIDLWKILDIAGIAFLLGWGVGKIGCHLSTCNLGRPTQGLFSGLDTYPIDLMSMAWALTFALVLFVIYQRKRLADGVVFFLSLEGFFLGELLIKTLRADYGEGIARAETLLYLGLVVATYLVFWKIHGPKVERNQFGLKIKSFVFRRRRGKLS